MTRILIGSANPDKAAELARTLRVPGIEPVSASSLSPLPPVAETEPTLEGNALLKARAWAAHYGAWALADDTGLEVDALQGAPGVFSARFAGANASYADNVRLLLERLAGVSPERRGARFRCVIALAHPGGKVLSFEGLCEGRIAGSPRGSGGFGYDPVFIPSDPIAAGRSFAELSPAEKDRISHRGRALASVRSFLEEHGLPD